MRPIFIIHYSVDGHWGCFQFLALVNRVAVTWINRYFCSKIWSPLGIYPGMVQLHHVVDLFLAIWDPPPTQWHSQWLHQIAFLSTESRCSLFPASQYLSFLKILDEHFQRTMEWHFGWKAESHEEAVGGLRHSFRDMELGSAPICVALCCQPPIQMPLRLFVTSYPMLILHE